jgi:hypothetical protein
MDHAHRHVVAPLTLLVVGLSVILGVSYGSGVACPTNPLSIAATTLCPNVASIPTCPRSSSSFTVTFQHVHVWGVQVGCFHPTS